MTDQLKTIRPTQEIKQEYFNISGELGDVIYNSQVVAPKRIKALHDRMDALNEEFKAASTAEAALLTKTDEARAAAQQAAPTI
jgi:hypothetical protein